MSLEREESIAEQAAHWWVVLRDENVSAAEKREFAEWVSRAPERVEACLRLARVHAAVSRNDVRWPQTPSEDLVREALAAPEDSVVALHPRLSRAREDERPRRRTVLPWAVGLAASVVLAACLGWWLTLSRPEQFQTKLGEQRSVLLADGSRVTLNTASKIEVQLKADHRVVQLLQGEALFEVAHDAARPFDVQVGNVSVRAVGTQFDIDRRAARTTVTVMEGRVAMAGPGTENLPVMTAGDRIVVDSTGPQTLQHGVSLPETTAWTQRQLVFQHRALGEIAEEFNRYNAGRIDIRSPALRAQEVTGTFRSDDVASFVAVLAGIPGVKVESDAAGNYLVTAGESAAPPP